MFQIVTEKKVVRRKVAIALVIIVIILAVGLAGAVVYYTGVISGKDSTIASKDSTITDLNSQITSKNSQISSKDSLIQTLTSEKDEYQAIANLEKSLIVDNATVSIPAGFVRVWTFVANYAGYLEVKCQLTNTTGNYAWVKYSSHGVDYDNLQNLVTDGRAVFPILPSTSIEIGVGSEPSVATSITIAITFHY